jgi:predicted transcriptional regulator
MVEKRYLKRAAKANAYVYSPRVKREAVSRQMLGDIVDRVFDGSAKAVMVSLLDRAPIDAAELKELRQLIDRESKRRAES